MRGTAPTLDCDHEDGCTQWIIDYYGMGAENWRDHLKGWHYDPYMDVEESYCPDHRQEAGK